MWRELDHPRHPDGRFRDQSGWAGAVSAKIRTPEQDLLDLVTHGEMVDRRELAGGNVAHTMVETYRGPDGVQQDVVSKSYAGRSEHYVAREVVVAAIGRAIGAPVPPTVIDPGDSAGRSLYMDYIDGRSAAESAGGLPPRETLLSGYPYEMSGVPADDDAIEELVAQHAATPGGRRLGLLDLLVTNIDRHAGNWLIDRDGKVVGIDHSHVDLNRGEEVDHYWVGGAFADSYLEETVRSDLDGINVHTVGLKPIPDLSPDEAARMRSRLAALFEREDIRRLLIRSHLSHTPASASEVAGRLLRRWDRIAEMAQGGRG